MICLVFNSKKIIEKTIFYLIVLIVLGFIVLGCEYSLVFKKYFFNLNNMKL